MSFSEIYGQKRAVELLKTNFVAGRISHAYLFYGPKGVGKFKTARVFTQLLNCNNPDKGEPCDVCSSCRKILSGNHPDVEIIRPEGSSVKIEQTRALHGKLYYKCYEGEFKVIMLDDADFMTVDAANSLLKALEEPPERTVFILIAEDMNKLPITIQSRCQLVSFVYLDDRLINEVFKEKQIEVSFPLSLAQGSLGKAMEMSKSQDYQKLWDKVKQILTDIKTAGYKEIFAWTAILEKDRELLDSVLEWMLIIYRDRIVWLSTGKEDYLLRAGVKFEDGCDLQGCFEALDAVNKALYALKCNGNVRLTMEVLLVELKNVEQNGKRGESNDQCSWN